MNRRTHMAVGAAASLAVLRPAGLVAYVVDVVGGMLGGWICDIDLNTNRRLKVFGYFLRLLLLLALLIVAGERLGLGLASVVPDGHLMPWSFDGLPFDWATKRRVAGAAAFLLVAFEGATSARLRGHRTFMHSLLAVALLTGSLCVAYPPLAAPFALGMLLHIVLDLTNKQGVQVLFPLSWRPCLRWFDADGGADRLVFRLSLAAMAVLLVSEMVRGV